MDEEPNFKEKVDEIYEAFSEVNKKKKPKIRKIKIPRRAKVRKRKLKQGWVGMFKIDENGNMSGEKVKIEGSAFDEKAGKYHATDGREIVFFNGKFPVIIQETKSINPIKFNVGKNETYGQEYIRAKMLGDFIKSKKMGGSVIIWLLLGAGLIYALTQLL